MSRRLRPELPTTERMAWIRTLCAGLCEQGLLRITQRGEDVGCRDYRGPVRIALTEAGRAQARDAGLGPTLQPEP